MLAFDVVFLEEKVGECLPDLQRRAHRQGAAKRHADRIGDVGCPLDIGLGQATRSRKGDQLSSEST